MKNPTTTTNITIFPRLSNTDKQWKEKVITLNTCPQSTCTRKRLQTNNAKKKKNKPPKTHDCLGVVGSQENLTLLHNPCSEFLEGFQVFSSLQGQKEGELKLRFRRCGSGLTPRGREILHAVVVNWSQGSPVEGT